MNGIYVLGGAEFVVSLAGTVLARRSWLGISFGILAIASGYFTVLAIIAGDPADCEQNCSTLGDVATTGLGIAMLPIVVLVLVGIAYAIGGGPAPNLPGRIGSGLIGLAGAVLVGFGILLSISEGPAAIMLVAFGLVPLSDAVGFHVPGTNGPEPRYRGTGYRPWLQIDGFPHGVKTARVAWAVAIVLFVVAVVTNGVDPQALAWACTAACLIVTAGNILFAGGLHRLRVDSDGLQWQAGRLARRFVPWAELESASVTRSLQGPALVAGEATIPLSAFKVDPEPFAKQLRKLAKLSGEREEGITALAEELGVDFRQ